MEQFLYKKFKDLDISYEILEHEPFFTCDESADFSAENIGGHAKTLFLRDKKKRNYFLAIVAAQHQIDTKELCNYFECSGGKLSFASAEDLEKTLRVTPGSVTPFALLSDSDSVVNTVLIDESLTKHDCVYFHPMRNTATVKLSFLDLQKFLSHLPHKVEFYSFDQTKK